MRVESYEGLLYWKLYSQPAAVANISERLRTDAILRQETSAEVLRISNMLPATVPKDVDELVRVLTSLTKCLFGMGSSCALPVRTTFLHFVCPEVMPILDKQVLAAVGITDAGSNQSYEVLRDYLPHAWLLAEKYRAHFGSFRESAVRVIDMALWVSRGK